MTSEQFAAHVRALADKAANRALTVGREQYERQASPYAEPTQSFELFSVQRLRDEAMDEFADSIAYTTMAALKMESALRKLEVMGCGTTRS